MIVSSRDISSPLQWFALVLAILLAAPTLAQAQGTAAQRQNPDGEWRYQSADAWGTRYSPADQIDASNFSDLEEAWIWRADNFGPEEELQFKATPQYINGTLYTLAGHRRTVAAIDPGTGETLWTYREPNTRRWERSMRQNWRQGSRLRGSGWERRDLLLLSRLLPACPGCEDRTAARRIRSAGSVGRLPGDRSR